MSHITTHDQHTHTHGAQCGHTAIMHNNHIDYLHDGHLHAAHAEHYDEHTLEINEQNPATCTPVTCTGNHRDNGDEIIPHGDHQDYLYQGMLHHPHGDHCDNHGPVAIQ